MDHECVEFTEKWIVFLISLTSENNTLHSTAITFFWLDFD